YSDYSATLAVSASAGDAVNFSITSANSTAGMGLWVDWNSNLVFDEPEEHIYNSGAYSTEGNGTIVVPAGTPSGSYRMRVVANYLSQNPTPCGFLGYTSSGYGEAEDYTFLVVDPPSCFPVTVLGIAN